MTTKMIVDQLRGGDRRSIGRSNEVVAEITANSNLFSAVFLGLLADDPVLRARAADAIEKVTRQSPQLLNPYKSELLGSVARLKQKEVRWHIAQMLPRLKCSEAEQRRAVAILKEYLRDSSSIVRTFAMQALADFADQNRRLRPAVIAKLQKLTVTGTPAMRARGRILLKRMQQMRELH
jgi:HEAT repeat protein